MEALAPQRRRKFATLPTGYYLPIVRYQNLYHRSSVQEQQQEQKYCGTFFFYEPESSVYLFLDNQKTAFFATKFHAWMELRKLWYNAGYDKLHALPSGDSFTRNLLYAFNDHEILHQHLEEYQRICKKPYLPENFRRNLFRYRYFARFMNDGEDFDPNWHNVFMPLFFPTQYMYDELQEGGVGDFDDYDQDICVMARDLGYTNLILQHEIGGHDCVTEILHTGSNANRFLFTMERVVQKPSEFDEYHGSNMFPKIWFPESDGIVYVNIFEQTQKIPCTTTVFNKAFANIAYKYNRPTTNAEIEIRCKGPLPSVQFAQNSFKNQTEPFLHESLRPLNDFHRLRPTPKFEFEEKNV